MWLAPVLKGNWSRSSCSTWIPDDWPLIKIMRPPVASDDTLNQGYDAVAKNLVDFGYPDTTPKMVREIHEAMKEGKTEEDLPHGIIGRFAEKQIVEYPSIFGKA